MSESKASSQAEQSMQISTGLHSALNALKNFIAQTPSSGFV